MRRLRGVSGAGTDGLELARFEVVTTPAGKYTTPDEVDFTAASIATAPATVGAMLASARTLDLEAPPALDAHDHWFRSVLPGDLPTGPHDLIFEGLATLADVWLDGEHILHSENMFVRHELPLAQPVRKGAELVLCFRSLSAELAKRRPRPRWRTRIVDAQQLRWLRTSLIGRTPGFCPNVPVVGAYRPVYLRERPRLRLHDARLVATLSGAGGRVEVRGILKADGPANQETLSEAEIVVAGAAGHGRAHVSLERRDDSLHFSGCVELPEVSKWWPHTHGASPRSLVSLELAEGRAIELGVVGFRTLEVDRDLDGQGFGLRINGVSVFARGACWTTDDLLTLSSGNARRTLELVRDAGMNMLRVSGITAYESPAFYDLCDELGILIFQDFMFANMDYPSDQERFAEEVEREVRGVLSEIGARPCLAVLCGGSEVEQQVAMLGLAPALQKSPLFYELLPRLCEELAPAVPYVPSSPSGGELPFSVREGISHYYGVGAYLRPLEDARRAKVRFAAECLAFANVPCRETIESFMGDFEMPFHHPRWKQRVPRDRGVGWDFEDVRDHYLATLFQVAPASLRYSDPERYLLLAQAVVGEVMLATFDEFRSQSSSCRGALVFWLKDFWCGAGWGVIDARGVPKSAYYYLKRCLGPVSLALTDEGLDGVMLHASQEHANAMDVEIHVRLFRAGEVVVAEGQRSFTLAPRSTQAVSVDSVLGRFADSAYAYRFGPPAHDLVVAELRSQGEVLARAFHLPQGRALRCELDLGLSAEFEVRAGHAGVRVGTKRFAQAVHLDVPGYVAKDNWFHLEPAGQRWIELTPLAGVQAQARGEVGALNALLRTSIKQASTETRT